MSIHITVVLPADFASPAPDSTSRFPTCPGVELVHTGDPGAWVSLEKPAWHLQDVILEATVLPACSMAAFSCAGAWLGTAPLPQYLDLCSWGLCILSEAHLGAAEDVVLRRGAEIAAQSPPKVGHSSEGQQRPCTGPRRPLIHSCPPLLRVPSLKLAEDSALIEIPTLNFTLLSLCF